MTCNTLKVAEAIVVLEVVKIIVKKGREIIQGSIIVMNNNFKLVQMINNKLLLIQLALEVVAEVVEIKELIQSTRFNKTVKWIWSYQTIQITFKEDPS